MNDSDYNPTQNELMIIKNLFSYSLRMSKTRLHLYEDFLSILGIINDYDPIMIPLFLKAANECKLTGVIPDDLDRILRAGLMHFLPYLRRCSVSSFKKRGKNNSRWKGGITPHNQLIRRSPQMKQWRIEIFKRDNYICQTCNQKGTTLHAHHIKPFAKFPDLRFDINNGITLCVECHKKEHSK